MRSASEDGSPSSVAAPEEAGDPEELGAVEGLISRLLAVTSSVLLVGVFSTVLLQVVMRYFFNSPLTWTDEATRLQLVWLTFIGAVLAYRLGADIAVDAFEQFARKRNWTRVAAGAYGIVQLTILLVAVAFVATGWQLAEATMDRNTPALGIPVATFYVVIPIAGLLLLVSVGERLWAWHRSRTTGAER